MVRPNEDIFAQMMPREIGGFTTMFHVEIQGAIISNNFLGFQKTSLGLLSYPIYFFNLRLLFPDTCLIASTIIEKIGEKQRYFKKNEFY